MAEKKKPTEPEYGSDEWADKKFPDRGEAPSNEVAEDPDAEPAPNEGR